ncbi:MAG: wax ester/triacylglycerol synthase domain-containing protein [Thermodesulfobacteriota bacterium]
MSTAEPSADRGQASSYAAADEGSLLHHGALVSFDEPVRHDDVLLAMERAARAHPFLRMRPARLPLAAEVLGWSIDPAFRTSRHVRAVELDAPADDRTIAHVAGTLWARPLAVDRPPWHVDLLTDRHGLGVALLLKAHPALLRRGLAPLVEVLLGEGAEAAPPPPLAQPAVTERRRGALVPSLLHAVAALAERGAQGSRALATEVASLLRPSVALARTVEVGRVLESTGTLVSSPAPETPWNGALGNERAVGSLSLPLDGLRGIAEGFGGTWRDAWVTVVADALGRVLRARGRPTSGLTLLAFVPEQHDSTARVAGEERPAAPGAGPALIALPVGELDPGARHALVRASAREPLSAARGIGLARMAALAQRLPEPLQSMLGSLAFQAANVVVTSERAPAEPLRVGGGRITSLVPLAGLPWHVGLALAALDWHGDELAVGVTVDPSLLPSAGTVVEALHAAYAELATAAGVPPVPARERGRARARR